MIKNSNWQKLSASILGALAIPFALPTAAMAAPDAETAYIFNSFSFLIHGFMVALMAAGFCMLEAGLVRSKNATVQSTKNIALYSIAGLMYALVAITAEPLEPTPLLAIGIGGIGSVLVILTVPLLDRLKIDDVVGAIPVHLVAGIWGTLAVVLSNSDANLGAQFLGIICVGAFVIVTSAIAWYAIKMVMGVRADEQAEMDGLDKVECGLEAYPEFSK